MQSFIFSFIFFAFYNVLLRGNALSISGFVFPGCTYENNTVYLSDLEYENISVLYMNETENNDYFQLHYSAIKTKRLALLYTSSMVREYSRLILIKNTFASSHKFLAKADARIIIWNNTGECAKCNTEFTPYVYENLVFLYNVWGNVFGHWFHDCLASLIQIPDSIINKSTILLTTPKSMALKYTDILGYPRNKFIFTNNLVFAKNMYIHVPVEDISGQQVYGYRKLREILREKLKINNIVPFRYILSNRKKRREVKNWKDLTNSIKQTFTSYKWEVINMPYYNIKKISHLLAETKIWTSPCGSNFVNTVYMQNGTGICIIMGNLIDLPNYAAAYVSGVWAIGFNNLEIKHQGRSGNASIPNALFCIKTLLYAIENKKWPYVKESFHPFNLTLINERMGNDRLIRYIPSVYDNYIV